MRGPDPVHRGEAPDELDDGCPRREDMGSFSSLVLAWHHLFPPLGGAPLRNWQNIRALSRLGPVDVISIGPGKSGPPPPPVRQWKHFDISRLPQGGLFEMLRRKSWWFRPRVHPWSTVLWRREIIDTVTEMVSTGHHDLVLLEELWFHPFAALAQRLGCLTVFDAHNVEARLRPELAHPAKGVLDRLRRVRLSAQVASIERDLTNRADQIWCCSAADARELAGETDALRKLRVIPNTMDLDQYAPVRDGMGAPPRSRAGPVIAFVGSYSYAPNLVAARILVEDVFPLLRREIENVSLLLVGRDPAPWMLEAARREPLLRVTGAVADIRPYLAEASIVAVPLVQGSGTRLKILEAFAALRPVVSTPKGAEGIDVVDGEHLFLRAPADFAAAILELLKSPHTGADMARRAYALAEERYAWPVAARGVHSAVAELARGRSAFR